MAFRLRFVTDPLTSAHWMHVHKEGDGNHTKS